MDLLENEYSYTACRWFIGWGINIYIEYNICNEWETLPKSIYQHPVREVIRTEFIKHIR